MAPVLGKKESVIPPEWLNPSEYSYSGRKFNLTPPASEKKLLIDELPNNIFIDPIEDPSDPDAKNAEGNKTPIMVERATSSDKYAVEDPRMLQTYLPTIKRMFNQKNFNFTRFKAALWVKQMRTSQSVAYQLSLLIPDIVRPPLTSKNIREIPHLFIYLFGDAGQGRNTIGTILRQQWLYSFRLSEVGYDSDTGIMYHLSHVNRDLLLIANDLGTATSNLKEYQKQIPAMLTNFTWDGFEVSHTKGEGVIQVTNNGVSCYAGGNMPLGQGVFNVRDVSRVSQNYIPGEKGRTAELLSSSLRGDVKLSDLMKPEILYTHYVNGLLIKGQVKSGIFKDMKVEVIVPPNIIKQIAGLLFRNWIPKVVGAMTDDEIWEHMDEFANKVRGEAEDTNAMLRIATMAEMFVRDSVIDNLLIRPYYINDNKICVEATQDDLQPLFSIMDEAFWDQKRSEYSFTRKFGDTISYTNIPQAFWMILNRDKGKVFEVKDLYETAQKELEPKIGHEAFVRIYGKSTVLSENAKLYAAKEKLKTMQGVQSTEGHPQKFFMIKFPDDSKQT